MTFMSSGLKVRTEYSSVREFIVAHKDRFDSNVSSEAIHLERILEIQGGNEISQYCIGLIVVRLSLIHYSLVADINMCDDADYAAQRATLLALVIDMLLEVDSVRKSLDICANVIGETELLGDPSITVRLKGYLEQPWNHRDLHEVPFGWVEPNAHLLTHGIVEL